MRLDRNVELENTEFYNGMYLNKMIGGGRLPRNARLTEALEQDQVLLCTSSVHCWD
jgi:hypothetical protein